MANKQEILDDLIAIIKEVVAEDWIEEVDIDLDTLFNEGLELESIEFVTLAEQLQQKYGEKVNFAEWLSTKEMNEIIGLKVGDLVEFIESSLD